MTISKEQAHIVAVAIRPQIKAYIRQNRAKYEAWLKSEREKEQRGQTEVSDVRCI